MRNGSPHLVFGILVYWHFSHHLCDVATCHAQVLVNGLLDCAASPEECAREALALAAQGYTALKIKARAGPPDLPLARKHCASAVVILHLLGGALQ